MTDIIKAGDTVRITNSIRNYHSSSRIRENIGKEFVVDSLIGSSMARLAGLAGGSIARSRIELVRPADEVKVGTYIIILKQPNGSLAPANTPKVYPSDIQARKVADSMAAKHGGTFLVFKATDEFVMPTAKPQHRAL